MKEIEKIRKQINKIDENLIILIRQRASKIREIKKIKKNNNLEIIDKRREVQILSKLDSEYEKEIFKKIIAESRKMQE